MDGFELDTRARVFVRDDGDGRGDIAVATSESRYLIGAFQRYGTDGGPGIWQFCAVPSGVEISVWDERKDAKTTHRGACDPRYFAWSFLDALNSADEIYKAATLAGLPIDLADAALVREALARCCFFVDDSYDGEVRVRRFVAPKPKPRKRTQKLLDGGEDMTV